MRYETDIGIFLSQRILLTRVYFKMSQTLFEGSANVFVAALSKATISEKCYDLNKLIDESSTKLLHQNFPLIVQNIFGVGSPGWGIQHVNPREQSFECFILKEFLGCSGSMFRLIHKLQAESLLFRYDFPCSLLPPSLVAVSGEQVMSRRTILKQVQNISFGTTQLNHGAPGVKNQTYVRVTAFEFYFYHFAYCILTRSTAPPVPFSYYGYSQLPPSPDENLYYLLIDEYLTYFLPIDGSSPPTMQIPTINPQSGVRPTPWMPNVNSMLRKTTIKPTNNLGVTQNEIWRSDLLVHILVEFWLGPYSVKYGEKNNNVPPSEDLMRAVRRLVKHLHYFNNVNKSSFGQLQLNDTLLDQFKQNIMCSCLHPRLFDFLNYCFKVWPLNSTFRIVLETWLSYIQPWRYTDIANGPSNSDMRLSNDREIANIWYHFINCNLIFYNKLFFDSINRFLRMDISKQSNSLLLYRVAKIFGQPNLMAMIEEAEACLYVDKTSYGQSPGSYLAPTRSFYLTSQCPPYLISSEEVRKMINQLLLVCQQALGTVKKNTQAMGIDLGSRIMNVIGLGSLDDIQDSSTSLLEGSWKKSEQQILDAMEIFSNIFDLSIPDPDVSLYGQSHLENPVGPDAPDCSLAADGTILLSDLGRYEMVNNMKKLPVLPITDPELQPITSFENTLLVRLFYSISSAVNKKYGAQLQEICARPNFFGKFANYCFNPSYNVPTTSLTLGSQPASPRITFRFLAHYRTLFYIALYVIICRITGRSMITGIFYFFSLLLVYHILRVIIKEYT